MQHSTGYIVGFAIAVCLVCALLVSGSAVTLKPLQEANIVLDRQKKVLTVAGLIEEGQSLSTQEVARIFDENVRPKVIELDSGELVPGIDPAGFDQQAAMSDPDRSEPAPRNAAKVQRVPEHGLVFEIVEDGRLEAMIFPIEGKGLWSTLYGYIALAPDANTVVGITFYDHGETPGLGGEVDNPRWKALWPGRKVFDDRGNPVLRVKKGSAGPPSEDPHQVDGLSGATLTSRGVTALVQFWLGENGYGPYVERHRSRAEI
ncbi:MAG: Na(+)-translocating NADH-quinone reductase subunit C [bacterium]